MKTNSFALFLKNKRVFFRFNLVLLTFLAFCLVSVISPSRPLAHCTNPSDPKCTSTGHDHPTTTPGPTKAETQITNCDDQGENKDTGQPVAKCQTNFFKVEGTKDQITTALTIVFGVIGAMTVIYIILAALKFITSGSDPAQVAQARQSIIYGAIGLAIAITAEAIVNFVIKRL